MKAMEFANTDGCGMVITYGPHSNIQKKQKVVYKFDCESFSCHSQEKETLFFGGESILEITGVRMAENNWK